MLAEPQIPVRLEAPAGYPFRGRHRPLFLQQPPIRILNKEPEAGHANPRCSRSADHRAGHNRYEHDPREGVMTTCKLAPAKPNSHQPGRHDKPRRYRGGCDNPPLLECQQSGERSEYPHNRRQRNAPSPHLSVRPREAMHTP